MNTRKDNDGIVYTPPSNTPPTYGTPVTIHNPGGSTSTGIMGNGQVIRDK